MELVLHTLLQTEYFAQSLSCCAQEFGIRYVLFLGSYGAGKTTSIRSFVATLPNATMAEVSSPSFTLYNVYPTVPPCIHIDLYRDDASMDSIIEDVEGYEDAFFLIEWAESVVEIIQEPALCVGMNIEEDTRIARCSVINYEHKKEVLCALQYEYEQRVACR